MSVRNALMKRQIFPPVHFLLRCRPRGTRAYPEKSAGNDGGAEKSRAQSRFERFPVNFFFSGAQVGYEKVHGRQGGKSRA